MQNALAKHGYASPQYKKLQDDLSGYLMGIRFTARQVENLSDGLRGLLEEIRSHERAIMEIAINKCGMQRAHFIKNFPGNEGNLDWVTKDIRGKHGYSEALERMQYDINEYQEKLKALQPFGSFIQFVGAVK